MSELTPEARALLELARERLRPSEADRARSLAALHAELGPEAVGEGIRVARRASSWKGAAIGAASGAAVITGAVAWLLLRPASVPVPNHAADAPPRSAAVFVAPSANTVKPAAPSSAEPVVPADAGSSKPPAAKLTSKPESLAEEVALLARATADLNEGRNAQALRALDEHRCRFPHGQLTQERHAARARALCALGRTDEAKAELARLAARSADSPEVVRARRLCGLDSKP